MKNLIVINFLLLCGLNLFAQADQYDTANAEVKIIDAQLDDKFYAENYKLLSSKIVQSYIVENLVYPKELEEKGIQGSTTMELKVSKSGKLIKVNFLKSSHEVFDSAIENLLIEKPIGNLRPYYNDYTVYVPIKFRLTPF